MLIATTCKPFQGDDAIRQRNALFSWTFLPDTRIVVFGEEAKDFCAKHGIENLPVKRKMGLPLLSDIFNQANELDDIVCYMNSDVLVSEDFIQTAGEVANHYEEFVIVGQRWDVPVDFRIDFFSNWRRKMNEHAREHGELHPEWGMDYFIWRGAYKEIPDFIAGVVGFDNWLVWKAVYDGYPTFNATETITALHQEHGGTKQSRTGEKADYNIELSRQNGCHLLVGIKNATHTLRRRK